MLYIFIQIITYKHKVDRDKKLFNILFIEEPESHLHPQMQSTFLDKVKNILGYENNMYSFITTHSSYILQKADLSNIRYFLHIDSNIYVKSLCEFFNQEGYSNLEDFIKKYFKINTCDLFFADKAILVEGTVERILMPLLIQKYDTAAGTNLSKQHLSIIEVGGAYAHIFNELLNFLEIKTLIVTDIDSVTGSHNSKCKCDISSESDDYKKLSIKTSNTVIKDWFDRKGEPLFIKELALSCLQNQDILVKKSNQYEFRKLTFQLPALKETLWGRTFEEQLIIENNSYFEILLKDDKNHYMVESLITAINQANIKGVNISEGKNISKDLLRTFAYEIVENIEKTSFALDLLVLDGWQIPSYIEEGFKWLQL
jgi:predicted ATP-dependent endonuclease of OLD family